MVGLLDSEIENHPGTTSLKSAPAEPAFWNVSASASRRVSNSETMIPLIAMTKFSVDDPSFATRKQKEPPPRPFMPSHNDDSDCDLLTFGIERAKQSAWMTKVKGLYKLQSPWK
jgi:hypothetical protein